MSQKKEYEYYISPAGLIIEKLVVKDKETDASISEHYTLFPTDLRHNESGPAFKWYGVDVEYMTKGLNKEWQIYYIYRCYKLLGKKLLGKKVFNNTFNAHILAEHRLSEKDPIAQKKLFDTAMSVLPPNIVEIYDKLKYCVVSGDIATLEQLTSKALES